MPHKKEKVIDITNMQDLGQIEDYIRRRHELQETLHSYRIGTEDFSKKDKAEFVAEAILLGLGHYDKDCIEQQTFVNVLSELASDCKNVKVAYQDSTMKKRKVNMATWAYLNRQPELGNYLYQTFERDNTEDHLIAVQLIMMRDYNALLNFMNSPHFNVTNLELAAVIGESLPIGDVTYNVDGNIMNVSQVYEGIKQIYHSRGTSEVPPAEVTVTPRKRRIRPSCKVTAAQ